ncbi:uncharacterized protein [Periplaneta americana]|uniref:uncharacterized protein n=1 Tax=Periplaneta americana TaxID=6978 RepID=UPI0037E9900B
MNSSSDEEEMLALFTVMRKCRKRKWVHDINKKREQLGEYHRLCRELESFKDRFFIYFRMSRECFETLHQLLEPKIEKFTTNWRRPIPARERLAICLRHLATGDSHQTIAFSFRLGRSTVSKIVKEVCKEIWNVLQPLHLPTPTEESWKRAEIGFREIWNFPNCIGSIDGKHIRLKCPCNSGSNYFCYKNFFSIVLLAIVDPFYKFLVVDIGSYGRHSDSGIFENSKFYREFIAEKTLLPPKPLPGTNTSVPHVLIGDEGFGLHTFLMRPFPKSAILNDPRKKQFNQRLSRARRVVENAFGILTQKWRIFFRPIETNVETAVLIVQAACCLHNYIRNNTSDLTTDIIEQGENGQPRALLSQTPSNRRANSVAFEVRQHFVNYFNNDSL